jgi:hypothetical protein
MDRGATTENGFTDQNIISTMQGTDEDKKKDLLFPNSFKNASPDQKYEKFKERFNDEIKVAIYHKRMEEFLPHYIDISVVKHIKAMLQLPPDTKGVAAVQAALELAKNEIDKTNYKDYTGNSSREDAIIVLGFMYGKNSFSGFPGKPGSHRKKTKVLRELMMQIIPHGLALASYTGSHLLQTFPMATLDSISPAPQPNPDHSSNTPSVARATGGVTGFPEPGEPSVTATDDPFPGHIHSIGGGRRRTKKRKTKKRKSKKRKSKRRRSKKRFL